LRSVLAVIICRVVLPVVVRGGRVTGMILTVIIAGLVGPGTMKAAGVPKCRLVLQGCVNKETTRQ
jgi:hypothetical protein